MNPSLIGVGVLVGAMVMLPVGIAYARAKLGWARYKGTKASVPALRRTAWSLTGIVIKTAFLAGAVLTLALWLSVQSRGNAGHVVPNPAVSGTTTGR